MDARDNRTETEVASPKGLATIAVEASPDAHGRRTFLKILGLSVAAGALSGCKPPRQKILPYVQQPPETTPGVGKWYATTCHGCSAACGALVKVMDGKPIKLEGNPEHPLSRGGLCAYGQGTIVGLYDPYRQREPAARGKTTPWTAMDAEITAALDGARTEGEVVVLTGPGLGPTTQALLNEFIKGFPHGRHVVYSPTPASAVAAGYTRAYGAPIQPSLHLDRARVIVSFGADFLGAGVSPVEYTKQYADARSDEIGTFHHIQVEAGMTLTGANADTRFVLRPSDYAACAAATLRKLTETGTIPASAFTTAIRNASAGANAAPEVEKAADAIAAALAGHRGQSLVLSDSADVELQTVIAAMNDALGNVGKTIDVARPILQAHGDDRDMAALISRMEQGKVAALIIHDCNPAHTWPRAEAFKKALARVGCSISTAIVPDETARLVQWHCPTHHPMERWGDAEPVEGVHSLYQPTIRPLYRTRAFEDSLLQWSARPADFHAYLQNSWRTRLYPKLANGRTFDAFWDEALMKGVVSAPAASRPTAALRPAAVAASLREIASRPAAGDGYQVALFASVGMRDGAAANNPWLQELPDPVTKITWDNGALMAPKTAAALGINEGQWVALVPGNGQGSAVELPVIVQPGQHPQTISVALGYGRTAAGPLAKGHGADAYPLMSLTQNGRGSHAPLKEVKVLRDRPVHVFARTQPHDSAEERDLVREEDAHDHAGHEHGEHDAAAEEKRANLWGPPRKSERQWGMTIDLNRCIGCSACVTSCDIENNIPAVGPEEVARSREMHWMRLDRYYAGDRDNPEVEFQPMLCQHCANASCESVCPVLATMHDDQGLNVQVYNRCVGTRYCANNCPYKVRRFNWFDNQTKLAVRRIGLNPNVTVRSRGVMEKCSFCLQRIEEVRIRSRNEGRDIRDGEMVTACQQSCPADAIIFGDRQDPRSRVAQSAADKRAYRVLEEINRQPAISYLARKRRTEGKA